MSRLVLSSPLAGWLLPIEEIPDPVFAQRMVGEGVGIDPTGGLLHAPCAGRVFAIAGARHALTLRPEEGGEILLHLGIDTVKLDGAGIEHLVGEGEQVASGQALLRFDLDLIARRAPSAVTPVLLPAGGRVLRSAAPGLLAVGDFLMEVEFEEKTATDAVPEGEALRRNFRIPFVHGLHARPAAQLAASLRAFAGTQVRLRARAGEVDAASTTALMALGTRRGDSVEVIARGAQAQAALDVVAALLSAAEDAPAVPMVVRPSGGVLEGRIASRGLALGPAFHLPEARFEFAETAEDPAREAARLQAAVAGVHASLASGASPRLEVAQSIRDAHAELAIDPGLHAEAQSHIDAGASASAAWRRAIDATARSLDGLDDARMRERAADLRDVERMVLQALQGKSPGAGFALPDGAILLAGELLPSQLVELPHERLAGIATARGGPTSHVALIASALGIPMLVALGDEVLAVAAGEIMLLDAERGRFDRAPSPEAQARTRESIAARRRRDAEDLSFAAGPGHTRDGVHVAVLANLGAAREALPALECGAEGCGLLRTEFLFLDRATAPDEDEQYEQYRRILDALAGRPLTIRTMDAGGDKPIPYLPLAPEDNPALGLRGLRTGLAHPQLLRTQLRAILRLRSPQARILLPMVNDLADLRAARALLRECADELAIEALPPLGAMVETPAAALLAAQLLREADFLSIGSNDLSQYTLAIDRGHPQLSSRLDALHPAVLRLVGMVAAAGEACGREVAVCGGLASDPEAIALLVGLGVRELSAVPAKIPMLKRILRGLDVASCRELARRALELEEAGAVRALAARWPGTNQETEMQR